MLLFFSGERDGEYKDALRFRHSPKRPGGTSVTSYILSMRAGAPSILILLLVSAGCRPERAAPPHAELLVAAGDSTYWISTGPRGLHSRGSPIQLARFGGRFYEIYVVDDDRSYTDAEVVAQQVWRRDLITNDSALVFRDTTILGLERWYARAHPDDRRLDPDESLGDMPHVSATSRFDVLDQFGPFMSYDYSADLIVTGGDEWHYARRGVLDLRDGGDASLATLFGDSVARSLRTEGLALFGQALDSVLASDDARAREAADAIGDFGFDSSSFAVVSRGNAPEVEFVVPGHGSRAGGLILPLPPIPVPDPRWWSDVRRTLPASADSTGESWRHDDFRLVARLNEAQDSAHLTLVDSAGREWPVGVTGTPVRRVYWLDRPETDSTTIRALARAFDEAALYSDDARTAMTEPTTTDTRLAGRAARPVRDSQHETSEIMMPQHANILGHVFGGVILSMMDRTAAVAAIRHARGSCVTVSVDRVDFREPIHVGDLVIMKASVNYAGRTSMEIGVRVEAENMIDGVRRHTNSCYLTFVAIDNNGRPIEVPKVLPETPAEERRFSAAMERRRRRLEERAAEEG
jgi:acyl-CoA hydrolase